MCAQVSYHVVRSHCVCCEYERGSSHYIISSKIQFPNTLNNIIMTFRHHLEQNAHETWVVYRN